MAFRDARRMAAERISFSLHLKKEVLSINIEKKEKEAYRRRLLGEEGEKKVPHRHVRTKEKL